MTGQAYFCIFDTILNYVVISSPLNVITNIFNHSVKKMILHQCLVFFWSSVIIDCMFLTFENRVALRDGIGVAFILFPLMNSFNETEAAIFPCKRYASFGLSIFSQKKSY